MPKAKKPLSTLHAYEIAMNKKIIQMTSKIQDLGAKLEASISHLVNQPRDGVSSHHIQHLINNEQKQDLNQEPETVSRSTCLIRNCSSTTVPLLKDEREEDDDDTTSSEVNASISRIEYFYKHPGSPYLQTLIPKSRDDWVNFLVWLVKQRVLFKYLTDVKLKRVIEIARGQIGRRDHMLTKLDPTIPSCYYWNKEEVANWIQQIGFPHLKDAFLKNFINGRRLIGLDASALNKMGIQNWKEIKKLAINIRNIFGLLSPNAMRPLLRIPPFETFLKKYRIHNGKTYDQFTFRNFCTKYHFDYEGLAASKNLNAIIPCTCTILIRRDNDNLDSDSLHSDDSFNSDSLLDAPTVEFQVRHQFIRDHIVENIINDLIDTTFAPLQPPPTEKSVSGHGLTYVDELIEKILNGTLLDLGFGDPTLYTAEKVKFAAQIALALLAELQNSTRVMSDINCLKTQIKIEPEVAETRHRAIRSFMEDLTPIAALLALNQLTLEGIFRHQPEFEDFVDGIVTSADAFVQSVLSAGKVEVMVKNHIPYSSLNSGRFVSQLTAQMIDDLLTQAGKLGQDASKSLPHSQPTKQNYEHVILPVKIEENPIKGALYPLWEVEEVKGEPDSKMKKSIVDDLEEIRTENNINSQGGGDVGSGRGTTAMVDLELTYESLSLKPQAMSPNSRINDKNKEKRKLSHCGKTFSHRIKASSSLYLTSGKNTGQIKTEFLCHGIADQCKQQKRPQSAPQQNHERNMKRDKQSLNAETQSPKNAHQRSPSIERPITARDIWKELKEMGLHRVATPPASASLQPIKKYFQDASQDSNDLNVKVNLIQSTSLDIFTQSRKHTVKRQNGAKNPTPSALKDKQDRRVHGSSPPMSVATVTNCPQVLKRRIRKKVVVGSLRGTTKVNAGISASAIQGDDRFRKTTTPPGSVATDVDVNCSSASADRCQQRFLEKTREFKFRDRLK